MTSALTWKLCKSEEFVHIKVFLKINFYALSTCFLNNNQKKK